MEPTDCLNPTTFGLDEAAVQLRSQPTSKGFLALGQTVFWDEPMKAGLALAANRNQVRFIAGVHDTDYFAKMPGNVVGRGFRTLPHNDGSTKGLWSAAAEFSVLFGSETVITKDDLVAAGLKFDRLSRKRAGFLEQATEAWGWRGIVSMSENPPITNETSMDQLVTELCSTLQWAISSSVAMIGGDDRKKAESISNSLQTKFCEIAEEPGQNLAGVYKKLLEPIYSMVANEPVELETCQTSELLRFNRTTVSKDRFQFLRLFVEQSSRDRAKNAYNEAIRGYAGLYELPKFGTGAIPFDLVIPGFGRGTIRLGNRGMVINTPKPQFISFKKPIETLEEFANLIEDKFGTGCAVVGKAVTLIGLLGREFTFAFHEGASSYVSASKKLHQILGFEVNPILRIRYKTWDALKEVNTWFSLPSVLHFPFSGEEICAPSFASRWRSVVESQKKLRSDLSTIKKPSVLLEFLVDKIGSGWEQQKSEYVSIQKEISKLTKSYEKLDIERRENYQKERQARVQLQLVQKQMGSHFRELIFEKNPTEKQKHEREQFKLKIQTLLELKQQYRVERSELGQQMQILAKSQELEKLQIRRGEIELELELKRLRLIRESLISSKGLENANRRPSAWWIPLVSPDGKWFREVTRTAECYWEPMH